MYMTTIVTIAVWYTAELLRVDSNSFYHKENLFFFLLYQYEMMDVNWTNCGNHFTEHVNETIMLCALNLYSDVSQLFLNKIGGEKKAGTNFN